MRSRDEFLSQSNEAAEVLAWLDGGGETVKLQVIRVVELIPMWYCGKVDVDIVVA
jgi:hypothetical protein